MWLILSDEVRHKYSSMIWNFDAGLLTDDDGYQYGSAWMYYDLQ